MKSQAKPGKAKRPEGRARGAKKSWILEAKALTPPLRMGLERKPHPSHKPKRRKRRHVKKTQSKGENTDQEKPEKEREVMPRDA